MTSKSRCLVEKFTSICALSKDNNFNADQDDGGHWRSHVEDNTTNGKLEQPTILTSRALTTTAIIDSTLSLSWPMFSASLERVPSPTQFVPLPASRSRSQNAPAWPSCKSRSSASNSRHWQSGRRRQLFLTLFVASVCVFSVGK